MLQGRDMPKTLPDIISKIERESTPAGGLVVLVKGLKEQVIAINGLNASQQEQVNSIFDNTLANQKALGDMFVSGLHHESHDDKKPVVTTNNKPAEKVVDKTAPKNASTGQVDSSTGKASAGALQPGNAIQ